MRVSTADQMPNGKTFTGYKVTGNDGLQRPATDGTTVTVPNNVKLQPDGVHGDDVWEIFDEKGQHLGEYDARNGQLDKRNAQDARRP